MIGARNAGVVFAGAVLLSWAAVGCRPAPQDQGTAVRHLTLAAYTTPREVYGRAILPAFREHWKRQTGEELVFEESYLGSGAQSRAIASGFEADVAALSIEPDVTRLVEAGLVSSAWSSDGRGGVVTRSVVVIGVRPGNPKGIRGWDDLVRPDVEVLTPNPMTSGGAMWNLAAIYGAALRGATSAPGGDPDAAEEFLGRVLARVPVMDKGARESMITFEQGVGDAVITYENEILAARRAGRDCGLVVPPVTILIENPAAVVEACAKRRGTEAVARAFVSFLLSPGAQRAYAEHGFRPVDDVVAREFASTFPAVPGAFTIRDLGGWPRVVETLFGPGGVYERIVGRGEVGR